MAEGTGSGGPPAGDGKPRRKRSASKFRIIVIDEDQPDLKKAEPGGFARAKVLTDVFPSKQAANTHAEKNKMPGIIMVICQHDLYRLTPETTVKREKV